MEEFHPVLRDDNWAAAEVKKKIKILFPTYVPELQCAVCWRKKICNKYK